MTNTQTLVAYHGDPELKARFLQELQWHQDQDAIIQGTYGDTDDGGEWKGSAVGCSIHSMNRINGTSLSTGDHSAYEPTLGIPEWLAHLEDTIFEGLDKPLAKTWPIRFADAIPIGADLAPVRWEFCTFLLQDNLDRVLGLDITDGLKEQVVSAIRQVMALGPTPEAAARSTAESAWLAAWSAAWSTAESAAESAWLAAWLAYERYADHLIQLLKASAS